MFFFNLYLACNGENKTEPSTEPITEPSSEISTEPSQPSSEPTTEPSGEPTTEPSGEPTSEPSGEPSSEGVQGILLPPEEQIIRISMALRGTRPSLEEIQQVIDNPDEIYNLAEGYVESSEFTETVKDIYAETLKLRAIESQIPVVGTLVGYTQQEVHTSLTEEPLWLIEHVVENDLPFTEIVTADYAVMDEIAAKIWNDHTYDFSTGGKQQVYWLDNRPVAGLVTSNGMLFRHISNGANYHRSRVNMLTDAFLCESFSGRDIPLTGEIDLSDDAAVAEAVFNQTECIACHQGLDPLAAHFWGFRPRITNASIVNSYSNGCPTNSLNTTCYPITQYLSGLDDYWENLGLRGPNYYGYHSENMDDLGLKMADDPRFSQCVAKRVSAYLTQKVMSELSFENVAELQMLFESSGYNIKTLAAAVVTDPSFLLKSSDDESVPLAELQIIRPEQLGRMMTDLTGFSWEVGLENMTNNQGTSIGLIPMMTNDVIGMRAMFGGIDGSKVTSPTYSPTPVKLLALAGYAQQAAGYVVESDFATSNSNPILLTQVTAATTDEASIKAQLVDLHMRVLREHVDINSSEVQESYDLWQIVATVSDNETAWKTVLMAFFQSPDILFY